MRDLRALMAFGLVLLCAARAHGGEGIPTHAGTEAENRAAIAQNRRVFASDAFARRIASRAAPYSPVADVSPYRYLLFTSDRVFDNDLVIKRSFAQNLPAGMKLVVLTQPGQAELTRATFSQWIDPSRLVVATHEDARNGYWARDSFPVPVHADAAGRIKLVAAKYYRPFEGYAAIAGSVAAPVEREAFTFVGGNLLADEDGHCFAVDSRRLYTATAAIIQSTYGCRSVTLLPHLAGIGDVDEVIKPFPGRRMITTRPEYVVQLEAMGYAVRLLPQAGGYRTYANSVVVGDSVFMPAFQTSQDAEAQAVYESLGYRVFPLDSRSMSDQGNGSLHCITMAYPEVALRDLLEGLGATRAD